MPPPPPPRDHVFAKILRRSAHLPNGRNGPAGRCVVVLGRLTKQTAGGAAARLPLRIARIPVPGVTFQSVQELIAESGRKQCVHYIKVCRCCCCCCRPVPLLLPLARQLRRRLLFGAIKYGVFVFVQTVEVGLLFLQ